MVSMNELMSIPINKCRLKFNVTRFTKLKAMIDRWDIAITRLSTDDDIRAPVNYHME